MVLETHLLVVNTVEQNEPIGHQDVEANNEQVVDWLDARGTVGELDSVLGDSVDDGLHQNHDREVLDSPAVATAVPEKTSSEVHVARDGVVGKGRSLIAFLAQETETEIS